MIYMEKGDSIVDLDLAMERKTLRGKHLFLND